MKMVGDEKLEGVIVGIYRINEPLFYSGKVL